MNSKIIPRYVVRLAAVIMAVACFAKLSAADSGLSHSDKAFMEKAAKAGMKEVDVSKAVLGRLTNSQINATAQTMIDDHTAVNAELMKLAAAKGVVLPANDMKAFDKWSKKTKDLDEDYVKEMVEDHEDAVKLFEKGSKADDPEVAAFAINTLPKLQHHLATVKGIKDAKITTMK